MSVKHSIKGNGAPLTHGLEVAVADRELEIPAHGPQDHLGGKAAAAECSASVMSGALGEDGGGSAAPTRSGHLAQRNETPNAARPAQNCSRNPINHFFRSLLTQLR